MNTDKIAVQLAGYMGGIGGANETNELIAQGWRVVSVNVCQEPYPFTTISLEREIPEPASGRSAVIGYAEYKAVEAD